MDVICDRCKAEYEFDEALLGDKGTTVKCSACGHVFRVLPPNRDAGRSQLKLRFSKDGTVKSLGSLRELQQRIRAGEVSLDDELGRDGFPFRLLRDVPELKNFFMSAPPPERITSRPEPSLAASLPDAPTRAHDRPPTQRKSAFATVARDPGATAVPTGETLLGSAPTAKAPVDAAATTRQPEPRPGAQRPTAAQTAQPVPEVAVSPEARPRQFSKHTMMGVGPDDLQLPPPPRVPQFGGGSTSAAKPAAASPVRERAVPATSDKTLHGMPVVAPAGQSPATPGPAARPASAAPPAVKPSVRPAASASMDRGGTLPAVSAAAAAAVAAAPPQSYSSPAPANAGAGLGGASAAGAHYDADTGSGAYDPRPEPARRGVAPFDVASSAYPQVEGEVERLPQVDHERDDGPVTPAPKLYLDDDERPPERATEASSKIWLYVGLLLLIGGGTYFAASKLNLLGRLVGQPAPVVAPEPSAVVDAAVAESSADAGSEATAGNDAPSAPFAPPVTTGEPAAAGESTAATPAGEPAAAPSKADKPGKASEPPAAEPAASKPARDKRMAEAPAAEPAGKGADTPAEKPERSARAATDPSDYSGWVSRGDQLFSKGDHDGASKAYKAAIALRPSGSEANAGLGFALLNSGQARESLPHFDRASSSGYAEANIGLGDAYRKLGQPSSAKEAYQAYLDRLPTGARAEYARNALEKLKGGAAPSTDKPAEEKPPADKPAREPRPPASEYRPAGELIEPTAPPTTTPTAPSEASP